MTILDNFFTQAAAGFSPGVEPPTGVRATVTKNKTNNGGALCINDSPITVAGSIPGLSGDRRNSGHFWYYPFQQNLYCSLVG